MSERPVDAITQAEAARILGCHIRTVGTYIAAGRLRSAAKSMHRALSRADVEELARELWDWRHHVDDAAPYWVTGRRAAKALGVNRNRVRQLAAADLVPYVRHQDGTLMFRREQLQVIGNARAVRWAKFHKGSQPGGPRFTK